MTAVIQPTPPRAPQRRKPRRHRGLTPALAAILLLAAGVGGCQSEPHSVTESVGAYRTIVMAPHAQVVQAAEEAVDEMTLVPVSSVTTAVDGKVVAETITGTRISIVARPHEGADVSALSVRVGVIGDADLSRELIRRIRDNLGLPA